MLLASPINSLSTAAFFPESGVKDAAYLLLEKDPQEASASEITNRTVMETSENGEHVIATDSIAFGTDEDTDTNVLVTAGHTGQAVPYLLKCRPKGFICSDGGKGLDDSGVAGLYIVEEEGLAGATVDARLAEWVAAYPIITMESSPL